MCIHQCVAGFVQHWYCPRQGDTSIHNAGSKITLSHGPGAGVGGLAAVCCAPIEAEGIRPSEPGSTEAASERMSPARRAGGVEERGEWRRGAKEKRRRVGGKGQEA